MRTRCTEVRLQTTQEEAKASAASPLPSMCGQVGHVGAGGSLGLCHSTKTPKLDVFLGEPGKPLALVLSAQKSTDRAGGDPWEGQGPAWDTAAR